jgi:hypothetical protein
MHIDIGRNVAAAWFVACCLAPAALAQTTGYGWNVAVPVVAQTASYQSFIYVHSTRTEPVSVSVRFTGAASAATPGQVACPDLDVPADTVVTTSLTALCPSLNAGSNFGALEFETGQYLRLGKLDIDRQQVDT